MIDKYTDFILEKLINESLIYFTPPVVKLLNRLQDNNKIAEDLFNIIGTDVKPDVTFVGLSDREGYFTFSTMKNVQRLITKFLPGDNFGPGEENDIAVKQDNRLINILWDHDERRSNDKSEVFTKSRNPIKIGRLINNLFPGKYSDKEVEDFVNKFKSAIEQSGERFIEVSGEEIGKYYNSSSYKTMSGTLGSSCMARHGSRIFQIYIENPDVCRLLVLLEDDKVIGRALIWKLDSSTNNAEYFLDRQYTIKQSDVEKFKTYAVEKGWAYKTNNNHVDLETVTYKDESERCEMTVKIEVKKYRSFPYVDTFRRFDPKTGILYNDSDGEIDSIGCYILNSTDGEYELIEDTVYSDWYDNDINRDDAIYSRPLGDWIYRSEATEVTIGSDRRRGWYPDSYDDIVYLDKEREWCHVDDAVWSNYNDEYYLEGTTVNTICRIDDNGEPEQYNYDIFEPFHKDSTNILLIKDLSNKEWFKKLSKKYKDWDDAEAVVKDLLVEDYKKEYVLDIFKIETFLVKTDIANEYFYLTKDDIKLLDYEIDTNENDIKNIETTRITDWFDYYKDIESYKNPSLFREDPIITLTDLKEKISQEIEKDSLASRSDYWENRLEFINDFKI